MPVEDDLYGRVQVGGDDQPPGAFDPEAVTGTHPGPTPSSDAPGTDEEPHPPGDTSPAPEGDPIPEFPEEHRLDLEGLMYLGSLTDEFDYAGHRFVIRTLTGDDMLGIALIHKKWIGTLGDVKAYQMATTAACIVSVDGKALPIPLEPDRSLDERFAYVRRWYAPIHDEVYTRFLRLEQRQVEVLDAMGKASG